MLLVLSCFSHCGNALRLPRLTSPCRGARARTVVASAAYTAAEAELLCKVAATDRGQSETAEQRVEIARLIAALEAAAPPADLLDLNGGWRLLYASEAPYRSSPFFAAFRQATQAASTPVAVPSSGVLPGDSLAAAIFGITDAIPFYDVGSVTQSIGGLCSDTGCDAAADEAGGGPDGASSQEEPSDGTDERLVGGGAPDGMLTSRVEIALSRLFGLPASMSVMTTVSSIKAAASSALDVPLEVELTIQTTEAAQSTLTELSALFPALFPAVAGLLGPVSSGDALEVLRKGASKVRVITTYLSSSGLRISRPILELDKEEERAVFVYAREPDA